jgi:hypothetical protein
MTISVFKLVSRVSTVIWVAKLGYEGYKKGKTIHHAYKKSKQIHESTKKVKDVIKKFLK